MGIIIAPSLLAFDHSRFGEGAERAVRSGADWLHLDIMDGHFVPVIEAIVACLGGDRNTKPHEEKTG